MDFEMPGLQSEHVSAARDEAYASRFAPEKVGPARYMSDGGGKSLGEVAANVALKRFEPSLKDKLSHDQQSRIPRLNLLELVHIDETSENSRAGFANCCEAVDEAETLLAKSVALPPNLCVNVSCRGATSLFAKTPFKKGETVLEEKPLITCLAKPGSRNTQLFSDEALDNLAHELSTIAGESKRSLQSLCEAYCGDIGAPKCYHELCLPIQNNTCVGTAVFAIASRISHSCTPNVEQHWDSNKSSARFVATRDIEEGEELTLAYVDVLCDTSTRRTRIKENFGFQCLCSRCTEDSASLRASDIKRERIKALDEKICRAIQHERFENAVKFVRERIKLLQTEGLDSAKNLLRCEYDGFRASLELGNLQDSEHFFELACKHSDEAYGVDSVESCNLQLQARDLEFQRAMFEAIYQ